MIRNITWKCHKEKLVYLCRTLEPLAIASVDFSRRLSSSPRHFSESRSSNSSTATEDKTLNSVYSALWNLSLISSKCRKEMCSVDEFLQYLVHWLKVFDNQMIYIESVVGLSKCLVGESFCEKTLVYSHFFIPEQIYNFPNAKLREEYVTGLMNVVSIKTPQPTSSIVRNTLQALCLCIRYKNDEITNMVFHKSTRFQFDLRQLAKNSEMDKDMNDRIHELLEHVSYCSGLFKNMSQFTLLIKNIKPVIF